MLNKIIYKNIVGKYRITIKYDDGRVIYIPSEKGLKNNLIVNDACNLMAGLFIGDTNYVTNYGNVYLALGNGNPAWDSEPDEGASHQVPTVTQLYAETYRALPTTKIYIDGFGGSPTTISNYVRLIYNFDNTVAVDEYLREFGLFGAADATANSGMLFDYIIHPRFKKTSNINEYIVTFEIKF